MLMTFLVACISVFACKGKHKNAGDKRKALFSLSHHIHALSFIRLIALGEKSYSFWAKPIRVYAFPTSGNLWHTDMCEHSRLPRRPYVYVNSSIRKRSFFSMNKHTASTIWPKTSSNTIDIHSVTKVYPTPFCLHFASTTIH